MKRRGFLASMLALGAAPALALPGRFVPALPGGRVLVPSVALFQRAWQKLVENEDAVLRIYTGHAGRPSVLRAELPLTGNWLVSSGGAFPPPSVGPAYRSGRTRLFDIVRDGRQQVRGTVGEPRSGADLTLDRPHSLPGDVVMVPAPRIFSA